MTYGWDASGAWRNIISPEQARIKEIDNRVNEVMAAFGIRSLYPKTGMKQLYENLLVTDVYRIRSQLCTILPEVADAHAIELPADWKERVQAGIDHDMANEKNPAHCALEGRGIMQTFLATRSMLEEAVRVSLESTPAVVQALEKPAVRQEEQVPAWAQLRAS
jgi:hypothetical protein